MNTVRVAPLVEGDGEVQALPVLLRRVITAIRPGLNIQIAPCFKQPSASIRKPIEMERAINAVARIRPDYPILVLIDSDDDCPKKLGATLSARARSARPDLYISVVLAHREYEPWFLSAAESLAGKKNLRKDLIAPSQPEAIRNAKGWLFENCMGTARYSPTQDQAALSHALICSRLCAGLDHSGRSGEKQKKSLLSAWAKILSTHKSSQRMCGKSGARKTMSLLAKSVRSNRHLACVSLIRI